MSDDAIDRDVIKARFIAERGYWRPWTDALLRHNPRFLDRYAAYAGHPARVGPLTAKQVELIYVALDASSTHLFASGLKTHMEKALHSGATPQEILDVLHLVAAQGLDSVYQAVAMLAEERDRVASEQGAGAGEAEAGRDAARDAAPSPGSALFERIRQANLPAAPRAMRLMHELDPGYLPVLLDFLEHGRPDEGLADADRSLIEVALFACSSAAAGQPASNAARIRCLSACGSCPVKQAKSATSINDRSASASPSSGRPCSRKSSSTGR